MLDPQVLREWTFAPLTQSYTDRDTILYALSLGFGSDPTDARELPFVYERGLQAVPTMAAVLCHLGPWADDPRVGMTRSRTVHGQQDIVFHRPLPPKGSLTCRARVLALEDKGADKGALLHVERTLTDMATGDDIATILHSSFCRADGGFGVGFGDPPPAPPPIPEREADLVVSLPISLRAALLYRLNVDRNPLHIDPEVAAKAGFPKPILHGLCLYGMAARAILQGMLDYDVARLLSLNTRFSAPLYPGEVVDFHLWRSSDAVQFRAFVPARGVKVLDNGYARLG
jgi:acyl dehydratase